MVTTEVQVQLLGIVNLNVVINFVHRLIFYFLWFCLTLSVLLCFRYYVLR